MSDLISVIIPVYNVEKYINRCVESVLNQTYKNLEIILVDDGSLDSCPKICDEFAKKDKRVKVIHQDNAGVSNARNKGLINAKGDFIAFVDSDDWLELNMYEKMLFKQKETYADLVFCRFNQVFGNEVFKIKEEKLETINCNNLTPLYCQDMIACKGNIKIHSNNVMGSAWRVLFTRNVIENLMFDLNVLIEEDLLFVSQAVKKSKKCAVVDDYLYNYYFEQNSAVNSLSQNKMNKACNFAIALEKSAIIDENTIKSVKFNEYAFYYLQCLKLNQKLNNAELLGWNTRLNYREHKKNEYGFKTKLKFFLIKIKAKFILKMLFKLKKK